MPGAIVHTSGARRTDDAAGRVAQSVVPETSRQSTLIRSLTEEVETLSAKLLLSEGDRSNWSGFRTTVSKVLESLAFDVIMGCLIAFNIVVMIAELNYNSICHDEGSCTSALSWKHISNYMLQGIYTVELIVRLYCHRWRFFANKMNILDFVVVLVGFLDFVGDAIPSLTMLRMFRIARLGHAYHLLMNVRELHLIVRGFQSAMITIFWGSFLMMMLLMIWSMLAMDIIHPYTQNIDPDYCPRCASAFKTVQLGILTLFQTLVTGDSWGEVAVPIIEENPWAFVVFGGAVCTYIGFANLIVAVIVDTGAESREDDAKLLKMVSELEHMKAKRELYINCIAIDKDQSGTITMEELLDEYDRGGELRRTLLYMDVDRQEIEGIFSLIDYQHSGSVSYDEFVQAISKMKSRGIHVLLVMLIQQLMSSGKDQRVLHSVIRQHLTSDGQQGLASCGTTSSCSTCALAALPQALKEEKQLPWVAGAKATEADDKAASSGFPAQGADGIREELRALRRCLEERLAAVTQDLDRWALAQMASIARYGEMLSESRASLGSLAEGATPWPTAATRLDCSGKDEKNTTTSAQPISSSVPRLRRDHPAAPPSPSSDLAFSHHGAAAAAIARCPASPSRWEKEVVFQGAREKPGSPASCLHLGPAVI